MHHIKVVVVGDGAIGKTSLLISYASGGFPRDYQPTVFDNFSSHHVYQGRNFNLGLWDTAGQEDFDRLRPLGYNNTDVFLICYSVVNPPSYANVYDKWLGEITHYTCQNIPIVLVGTQTDLRTDPEVLASLQLKQQTPMTYDEGLMMKKKIGARAFTECSVQSNKGVRAVFEEAIRVYIDSEFKRQKRKEKKENCTLL
ncbi:Rho GTPase [Heterostelium album PN500]|uniref:Rho GTPase n=1 Tax=Heterostelium pallidum (strain ATCC 26659 / Pp 5 / PN500) TaxID=670386 RepID=D3BSR3_HETP5|nr:Rho GTPase [Heterostelium album PN500]EFA75528.1 Rho GTPase [Heterostelium album PN500]|eukprot:XP_020427662.1 Rho GTPase [Heterostelium album PN500]